MDNPMDQFPTLSNRERELLYLVAYEQTNAEIAKRLFISKNTVASHKKSIFAKLNVTNTAGLIRRAFELRILPMEIPGSLKM